MIKVVSASHCIQLSIICLPNINSYFPLNPLTSTSFFLIQNYIYIYIYIYISHLALLSLEFLMLMWIPHTYVLNFITPVNMSWKWKWSCSVMSYSLQPHCSLPGSSVYGIFHAIVLQWIAISFSRGSSPPRDWTQVSCIVDRRFTIWATREVRQYVLLLLSRFSRVRLCATPYTAAHQAPLSLGFSRQEHWSGLPFPSPMHES